MKVANNSRMPAVLENGEVIAAGTIKEVESLSEFDHRLVASGQLNIIREQAKSVDTDLRRKEK